MIKNLFFKQKWVENEWVGTYKKVNRAWVEIVLSVVMVAGFYGLIV